ncbi:YbhB/YbcL family Raf kinase inhibitor-like protein [Persephonella sp. KM09-Lau-8]|uniref:YbhB/YbcL family Raf kinase inhibitor-like protein n=1 Tax=Persephonella sp. KM09-Lau-8 TaxID=1158345 RepID=UPI000495CD4A|nr:YbhB/YbcL family Raf kinase inhibitor-like protein [Persephonella sp. KM09-Lau-8]
MILVKTSSFGEGDIIPSAYTCDGADISPELKWGNFPPETQSFVVIMDDPDAPLGTFTHWIVYDIPPDINFLPENFPKEPQIDGIKQGINDFGRIGYGGPCPPPGKPHRYFFKVFALDIPTLELPPGATRQEVQLIMTGRVIDEGYVMGLYGR